MPTMGWFRWMAAGRAVEAGVAVVEDAAVGGHQPVATVVPGAGDVDDGSVQRQARRVTEQLVVAEALHGTRCRPDVVALGAGPAELRRSGPSPGCRRRSSVPERAPVRPGRNPTSIVARSPTGRCSGTSDGFQAAMKSSGSGPPKVKPVTVSSPGPRVREVRPGWPPRSARRGRSRRRRPWVERSTCARRRARSRRRPGRREVPASHERPGACQRAPRQRRHRRRVTGHRGASRAQRTVMRGGLGLIVRRAGHAEEVSGRSPGT